MVMVVVMVMVLVVCSVQEAGLRTPGDVSVYKLHVLYAS